MKRRFLSPPPLNKKDPSTISEPLQFRKQIRLDSTKKTLAIFENHYRSLFPKLASFLSFRDLGNLGQLNKSWMKLICDWILDKENRKRVFYAFAEEQISEVNPLIFNIDNDQKNLSLDFRLWHSNFYQLGKLLKRVTLLYSTEKRLDLVTEFMAKIKLVPLGLMSLKLQGTEVMMFGNLWTPEAQLMSCCATLAFSYMAGWQQEELKRAFLHPFHFNEIKMLVNELWAVGYQSEEKPQLEVSIRYSIYFLYWKEVPLKERGFWLRMVLDYLAGERVYRRAQLLYIVFGPLRTIRSPNGLISWILRDEMTLALDIDFEQTKRCFQNLADALSVLHATGLEDVNGILNQILRLPYEATACYDMWDEYNLASLLLLCSDNFRLQYLRFRLTDNGPDAVSPLLAYLLIQAVEFHTNSEAALIETLFIKLADDPSCPLTLRKSMAEALWSILVDLLRESSEEDRRGVVHRIMEELAVIMLGRAYGKKKSNDREE